MFDWIITNKKANIVFFFLQTVYETQQHFFQKKNLIMEK